MADGQQFLQDPNPPIGVTVNSGPVNPVDQATLQWSAAQPALAAAPVYDPELHAAAVHHNRIAETLNTVSNIMTGGGQTLRLNRNPDGSVDVQQVDATPGNKWGRIAAAALSGAAKGFSVGTGPGGAGRAAGAGFDTGLALQQNQQDQTRTLAEQMNKQSRDEQLFKANMALMNQRIVQGSWQQHRNEQLAAEGEEDRQNQIQRSMLEANADHFHIDSEGNPQTLMDRLSNMVATRPEWVKGHADGRVLMHTTYDANNRPNGMDAYMIPEDKMNQLNEQPFQRTRLVMDDDGHTHRENLGEPIPARAMSYKNLLAVQNTDLDADNKVQDRSAALTGMLAQARANEANARANRQAAGSAASGEWQLGYVQNGVQMERNTKTGALRPAPTGLQSPQMQKADLETIKAIDKPYLMPARDVERAYQGYLDAFREHQTSKTGAADMAALAMHLGTTFGAQKGSRMTKSMIEEHWGARGVTDEMVTAVNRILSGKQLSENQWQEFGTLMRNSRDQRWRETVEGIRPYNVPVEQFLPPDLVGTAVAQGYRGQVAPPAGLRAAAPLPGAGTQTAAPAATQAPAAGGGGVWDRSPIVQPAGR